MFNHISDINLKELKKNHVRLYYFGLGFIQLKIDETYRLHFYSSKLPSITEDIHNHRYDFTSTVLKGRFINNVWGITEVSELNGGNAPHVMVNESCNPDISAPPLRMRCEAHLIHRGVYEEGQNYLMPENAFHTVKGEDCVTLLERGKYTKEFAQVVMPKDKSPICPFSKKIEDEVLWEIMAEML
jgi:hypothetical protein